MSTTDKILGLHIAPSGTQVAVFGPNGGTLANMRVPTEVTPYGEGQHDPTHCLVQTISSMVGRLGGVSRVGAAVAGTVTPDGRAISTAGHLNRWRGFDLVALLAQAADVPEDEVAIGNSAVARGMLEAQGVNVGSDYFALYLGDGVGGCSVHAEGDTFWVTNPEPGHIMVDTEGEQFVCRCGASNCLEVFTSRAAIARIIGSAPSRRLTKEQLQEMAARISTVLAPLLRNRPVPRLVLGGLTLDYRRYPELIDLVQAALVREMPGRAPQVVKSTVTTDGPVAAAGRVLSMNRRNLALTA